jgi:AcrR family transcriptional regulator
MPGETRETAVAPGTAAPGGSAGAAAGTAGAGSNAGGSNAAGAHPPEAHRPRRADALRNRLKVLEIAEELFARSGTGVPVDEIAREAGVGVGTVCRNFPTKQDLVDAVLVRMFEDLVANARVALAIEDPGESFEHYVYSLSDLQVRHRALGQHMARQLQWPEDAMALRAELRATTTTLLRRAQEAGAVRDDISTADLSLLFAGIAQLGALSDASSDELRRRYVAIVLDGLRPAAKAGPLPAEPLTYEQLDELTRNVDD